MQKVIFLFLLSLSMCLSRPDQIAPEAPALRPKDQSAPNAKTPAVPEQTQQPPNSLPNQPDGSHPAKAAETPNPAPQNAAKTQPEPHETNDTKSSPIPSNDNKTVPEKKEPAEADKVSTTVNPPVTTTNATEKDEGKATTQSVVTTSSAPNTKKNDTVTDKTDAAKTTEAPKHESTIVQARGFDGASFIGGIILTLGLLAIGFMGFKYYKNQTERNYHTL